MPGPESMFWVAAVTTVIWLGIFVYLLGLDRRVHRLEEDE